jgi:hypothetical protein
VAGSYLQPLLDAAAARGVTPAALEQAAGLDAGSLAPLPDSLPADLYVQLLELGAQWHRIRTSACTWVNASNWERIACMA